MTMLRHYFVGSVQAETVEGIAEDWIAELAKYPPWAINQACRWWMSEENPDRRRKPLPGDISARARAEMSPVRHGEIALRRFNPEYRVRWGSQSSDPSLAALLSYGRAG